MVGLGTGLASPPDGLRQVTFSPSLKSWCAEDSYSPPGLYLDGAEGVREKFPEELRGKE
jgi:hypothetical protein